jgi:hypothetical protein
MAMDALKNLTTNIPNWLTRLDDLSSQIDQRQAELAAIAGSEPKNGSSETKSLRNKGSTESLKPQDDGPSHIPAPVETPISEQQQQPAPIQQTSQSSQPSQLSQPQKPSTPTQDGPKPRTSPPSPGAGEIAATHRPTRDVVAAAHSRAKAQVKKRMRSSSMVSGDQTPQTYRTRSMIIVYYDSYVQGFFDELVRFVSSSRNLMRKAKMAAKVAQIKKMAEVEMSKSEAGGDDNGAADVVPSLRYMSSRRLGGMSGFGRAGFGGPGSQEQPDAYDNLDRCLETVQSTCEHGAHQFLRDADCNDEIKKIKDRLREALDMAQKEIERVQNEEPELAKESGELSKPRAHRPISVRRELPASGKEIGALAPREDGGNTLEPARSARSRSSFIEPATSCIEVDPNANGDDEPVDIEAELPKLQYRSTRGMRTRVQ